MTANTWIKISVLLLFVFAAFIQLSPPSSHTVTELVEVMDAKQVINNSTRGAAWNEPINIITVRFNNGQYKEVSIGSAPLPPIGSFIQLEVENREFAQDRYSLY